jgi:hypothetical protein
MDPELRPRLENLRLAAERHGRADDRVTRDEGERGVEVRALNACDRLLIEAEEAFGAGSYERSAAMLDRADALIAVTRRYVWGALAEQPR